MIAGVHHLVVVITWKPLVATAMTTATWLASTARPSGLLLSTASAAVSATTAHVLDDPAAVTLQSSPSTLLRRRACRVMLAVPVVAVWWVLTMAIVSRSPAHLPLAEHSLQLVALSAVGLAGASTAAMIDGTRSGTAGALLVIVCFGTAFLPARFLQVVPLDPAAPGAARRFIVILAVALLFQLATSIDPARRLPGRQWRQAPPATSIS